MCIDVDETKIENLKKGVIPIYEPWLTELVLKNYKNGRLQFSSNPSEGVHFSNVIFSAVGTPPDENHRADLRFVKAVAKTVGEHMSGETFFINKSTVPVGTGKVCEEIILWELKKREKNDVVSFPLNKGKEFKDGLRSIHVISNPEFLREGTAIKDFMVPDRIVCGVESDAAKNIMKKIYEPFSRSYVSLIFIDRASSEISKYAANAFLATKLSFINEIANFSELTGGNIKDITRAIGSDKRIGPKFLHAGIGYGGSCFPKDVDALIESGKDYEYDFEIIKATEVVNKRQKLKVVEKLQKHMNVNGKTIALWGLAFKPKTDDMREAPSLAIIEKLTQLWVKKIQVYDPVSMDIAQKMLEENGVVDFCKNALETAKNADALIVVTEWDEFRGIEKEKILENMSGNIIIDGRNIWNKSDFWELPVIYESIWIS
jgi:UDPglucose 6-dehydrogenase